MTAKTSKTTDDIAPDTDMDDAVDGPDWTDDGTVRVELKLQPRHAQFLHRAAQGHGLDVAKYLEGLVRQAYAADPTKGGQYPMATSQPEVGAGAITHLRNR